MERIMHYFRDAVAVNGYLWFLEDGMNALFRMNIQNSKIEYVLSLPGEKNTFTRLCNALVKCGDKLVCCPRYAKYIAIYDTILDNLDDKSLETEKCEHSSLNMFGKLAVGDRVYLQQNGYSSIYQLDVQTGDMCILDITGRQTETKADDVFWHWKMRQYKSETKIILYNVKQNILYKYDIETSETKKLVCFEEKQRLIDFETDGCWIWILCCDGTIYKLDENQVVDRYRCNAYGTDNLELLYYKHRIYIIDVVMGKILQVLEAAADMDEDFLELSANDTGVYSSYFGPDNCFWMQWNDGFFYYFDEVNEISGIFESNMTDIPSDAYFPNGIFCEKRVFLLEKMLETIKYQSDVVMSISANQTGERIYNTILKD